MPKPIISVDFDGVIHSYTSRWQGARTIPDPPVDGAMLWLLECQLHFAVHIFSSRSRYIGGRFAMKRWLRINLRKYITDYDSLPDWLKYAVCESSAMELWDTTVDDFVNDKMKEIQWPLFKPPAMITIDDRAVLFTGPDSWPVPAQLLSFKPWNKQ